MALRDRSALPGCPERRYNFLHFDQCAESGRQLLLELQAVDEQDTKKDGALKTWLDSFETQVEAHRTAYHALTTVDLGTPGTQSIEQQAA
jgi:hypothetical protein